MEPRLNEAGNISVSFMSFNWSGKIVLITGASSGIGRSLSIEIGKRGATLGLLARRSSELEEIAHEVDKYGVRVLMYPVDVTSKDDVNAAAKDLQDKTGSIDVLIANAGMGAHTPGKSLNRDDCVRVIDVNLIGAINSVTAVLPGMVQRQSGHLVAISSLAAYRGLPGSSAYCASKAAMSSFFESLRLDLHKFNIDVTIIHPGYIKTDLTKDGWHRMPFLMELDDATRLILKAIEGRKTSYAFPWQLASLVRFARFLPDSLYDRVMRSRDWRA
jgi:short-subunit dehydrogenase